MKADQLFAWPPIENLQSALGTLYLAFFANAMLDIRPFPIVDHL
jgi:hypothetical protein